jgi:hypothetical protein
MSIYSTDKEVLEALKAAFPKSEEKARKGPYDKKTRKNKYFTYIPVHFVRERLDDVLGFDWQWEIVDILPTSFQSKTKGDWDNNTNSYVGGGDIIEIPGVVINGRLTITLPSGKVVFRDGTGGATIDKGMGPGDAQKIAASNALKRAAYMFGVGAYLALDSDEALDDTITFGSGKGPLDGPLGTGGLLQPNYVTDVTQQTSQQSVSMTSPFTLNITGQS